nr:MAG TPA: hypothetical protein [Caudoviricetes sp.]
MKKENIRIVLLGIMLFVNFILLCTVFSEKYITTFYKVTLIITFMLNIILDIVYIENEINKGD